MAGGMAMPDAAPRQAAYTGRTTFSVVLAITLSSLGGAMYGYDVGITGGVTSMHSWQVDFFPDLVAQKASLSVYCTLNNQLLQLFTSSLYLAGMFSCLAAGWLTKRFGRKLVMLAAGALYIIGTILETAAQDLAMLIIGRVVMGLGVGLSNQVVPIYLSEISPYNLRGLSSVAFQLTFNIASLVAGVINYKMQDYSVSEHGQGWRVSLGCGVVPGIAFFLGCFFLKETPASLVERGQLDEARAVLQQVRACDDVSAEFEDIVEAARVTAMEPNQWRALLKPRYRMQFLICVLIAMFQQLTGVAIIVFYSPQVFAAVGSGNKAALLNTVIIGAVHIAATFIGMYLVDRIGRRMLFLEGGSQMAATLIVCGAVLGVEFGHDNAALSSAVEKGVLAMICIYMAGFAWSWGPLGYLIPTEVAPLEIRSAAVSAAIFTNLLVTFIIGQAFLSMLCGMEYGVFLFFAGWMIIMTFFTWFLLPETMNVPMEGMQPLLRSHWFWGPRMGPAELVTAGSSITYDKATIAKMVDESMVAAPL